MVRREARKLSVDARQPPNPPAAWRDQRRSVDGRRLEGMAAFPLLPGGPIRGGPEVAHRYLDWTVRLGRVGRPPADGLHRPRLAERLPEAAWGGWKRRQWHAPVTAVEVDVREDQLQDPIDDRVEISALDRKVMLETAGPPPPGQILEDHNVKR
jgi:hypothetical protein